MTIAELAPLLLGIAVLVGAAVVILRLAEVGRRMAARRGDHPRDRPARPRRTPPAGALNACWSVAAFIVLMLTTASVTSLRRARDLPRGPVGAVAGIVTAVLGTHIAAGSTRLPAPE